jgi:voltage-gated potassium channel
VYLAIFVILAELYAVIERKGPIEGLWWGVVSASTVGYGDSYPASTLGRGVGAMLIVVSVAFVAMGTAQLANHLLTDPDAWTHAEQEDMKRQLTELTEHVKRLTEQLDELLGIGKDEGDDDQRIALPGAQSPSGVHRDL